MKSHILQVIGSFSLFITALVSAAAIDELGPVESLANVVAAGERVCPWLGKFGQLMR